MDREDAPAQVLVIEDNPVERTLVETVLAQNGFEVVTADTGRGALAAAAQHRPHLILLDALLPDIDGFEVCQTLRGDRRTRFTPVVMLTGLDDIASIERAYRVGATDFLSKPIKPMLLVQRLRYLLRAGRIADDLRRSRESLAAAQQVARLGHWEYETRPQRAHFSDELIDLYGLEPLAGTGYQPLLAACHPEDRVQLARQLHDAIDGSERVRIEHRLQPRGGEPEPRIMEMYLAPVDDERGSRLLGLAMDITARKQSEREILRLAYFDRLTGLPNRSLLQTVLDQRIPASHRDGRQMALLLVDIDRFSRINNALGHGAGDAVLRQIATRLARQVAPPTAQRLLERLSLAAEQVCDPERGLLVRPGSDNFMVLLPVEGIAAARQAAEAMREVLAQPYLYRGQEIYLSASVGVALSDSAGLAADVLLQRADMALREAKRRGCDEIGEYREQLVAQVSSQLALQNDLRRALRRGEFQLHFQPKVAVRGGTVSGFEALLRWNHPERRIPPTEFIAAAEESGQIVELGRWALFSACHQFRQWLDAGQVHGHVAVNVSARQFRQPQLAAMVMEALDQSGLSPHHLELEITEGVLMSEPRAEAIVAGLRDAGISIALDDFGTGFSSLSYLTRFPIDTLKIDRCFVSGITHLSEKAAIVSALTTLSHQMDLKVVAEGVETESELQVIGELQCDEVQGYLVARPLPPDALLTWLSERRQPVRQRDLH